MKKVVTNNLVHPMGEIQKELEKLSNFDQTECDSASGKIHVVCDPSAAVTPTA